MNEEEKSPELNFTNEGGSEESFEQNNSVEQTQSYTPPKSGRHKEAICPCPKCVKKREKKARAEERRKPDSNEKKDEENTGAKTLEETLEEYEEIPADERERLNKEAEETARKVKPIISGYMLLLAVDGLFPGLVLWIFKRTNKAARLIEVESIKLSKEQRELLEPVADEAAQYIFKEMHPLAAFALSVGFVYSGNISQQISKIRVAEAKKEENKKK